MAKVTLPLGSAEAYGRVGKMTIYQGTWAKQYKAPQDPKSAAQLSVRSFFLDLTKMAKTAGPRVRAAFKSNFGSRWFTEIYRFCKMDAYNAWSQAEFRWGNFLQVERDLWNGAAPYQSTTDEPGKIFYCLLGAMNVVFAEEGESNFGLREWFGGEIALALEWWIQDLIGMPQEGFYDNGAGLFSWNPEPDVVADANAFGGSILRYAPPNEILGSFLFWGKQVRVGYRTEPGGGTWAARVRTGDVDEIDQASDSYAWGQYWSSELLPEGLHEFRLERFLDGPLNVDTIVIA